MSEEGGSAGLFIGAGIGGCAVIVVIIGVIIYCYLKARKEKAHTNMTKSTDVFSTAASNTQVNYPSRSRVNQFPDPEAARKAKRARRSEQGHSNPAYERHGSESSSSDMEGRDLSPPRVRRPRGGQVNEAFSSASSCDESSSLDDDVVTGSFDMENEVRSERNRSSYKRSKQHDLLDSAKSNGNNNRNESHRRSRRDQFNKRNPRSDSPLTIETLEKHEKITRQEKEKDEWSSDRSRKDRSRRRDTSPSRSYEGSEATGTSLVTEGTEFTATTVSSGQRFAKNPSLRRNSPSRSSSHRRYRKDNEKDSSGRRKPRRTRSSDRQQKDRSRSPGEERRSRSGSTASSGGSQRSRRSREREYRKMNQEQTMLPIFSDKKQSSV